MSAGDPDFDGKDRMEVDQELEGGAEDLMDTEVEDIKDDEELSNPNPPTAETGDSKIQKLTDEEAEKLQKQQDLKFKVEACSAKANEFVTKNNNEDYEDEKDGVEANSDNGGDSSNYPWTPVLAQKGETVFPNEVDVTAFSVNTKMDESLQKESLKNPLLLSPVVRCVLKFLSIKDIKNCRLVCRDWGSIGKPVLASRGLISFQKSVVHKEARRFPAEFQSCFRNSTSYFSAFEISDILSNDSWTIEELKNFFDEQQKYIKELTLNFKNPNEELVKKINLSSWISKSPMVQKEAKYLTKLVIEGKGNNLDIRPLHLIAHIKDLSLSNCKIHVEAGVKMNPIKLKLSDATFYQDGVKLGSVEINNVVDLGKAKEITLYTKDFFSSNEYVLDLWGSVTLKKLILDGEKVQYVNGEISQWAIEHLAILMNHNPFSLNRHMNIKELYLNTALSLDLFTIPSSIQNLVLPLVFSPFQCSQPIVLQNLQYLQVTGSRNGLSFLSHFMNCPQLTHLKLQRCGNIEMNSLWIPKTIKTLAIEHCFSGIKWIGESVWNVDTIVVDDFRIAKELCVNKIQVEDLVVYHSDLKVDKSLDYILALRKRFCFGKRLYVGELKWDNKEFEKSALFDHVEAQSSFYVLQDGQKGCAVSEKDFHALIPKHIDVGGY